MATIVWLFVLYLYNVISFLYHKVNCHLGPLWLQLYGCLIVLYLYNVISFLYHMVNCHLGPLWLQLYGCLSSTYIMSLVSYTTGLTVIWGLYGYNCMAVWLSSTYIMSLVSITTRLTVIWGPLWLQLYGCLIVLYLYNVISFYYHEVNCHLGASMATIVWLFDCPLPI